MSRYKIVGLSTSLAALFLAGISVGYAATTARPGGEKTAFCEQCHGPRGCAPVQDLIPKLCGQNAQYLEAQLMEFRDGRRPQPIMHSTTSLLSTDLLKQLAEYYSNVSCSHK